MMTAADSSGSGSRSLANATRLIRDSGELSHGVSRFAATAYLEHFQTSEVQYPERLESFWGPDPA
jgi:hypothetical protein